ncbi:MAG: SNF2-related protein [Pseudomonadota bacterium]|nr:SNF2-related protein [Pseudomonadota bacterium]
MICQVKIVGGCGFICDWTDDCNELFDLVLQPLPHQKASKKYETTQLRAFNLVNFFKANGVEVQVDIENPSEHARLTIWTQKLKTMRNDVSVAEVDGFIKNVGIDLRELQTRGLHRLLQSHFALLAAGCGAGKTLLNLCTAQFKKRKTGKVQVFVIAPSACAGEYIKELERFRGYFDLTMVDTCGLSSKEAKAIIRDGDCDVVLVSVDSISQLGDTIAARLQEFDGETLLIVEEGHSVKNVASKRSQGVQAIAPLFDQVIVSTATPLPLGAKDLRGYIGLVGLPQPEEAYTSGIPTQDYALLKGVAFVTDEDDVPYAALDTENIEFTDLQDLNSQISESVKLELSAGHKVVIFTSTNRALQSAYELFQGIPRTVLSGSFFIADCNGEQLGHGRRKELQKKAIDQFNHNPDCKVLIANYRVGSTGLNLQYSGARMAIFYEVTNSGADFFQSKYRIRRPNVFPEGGFRYVYAVPTDPNLRRTVNRQFLKLADQRATLRDLKLQSGSGL